MFAASLLNLREVRVTTLGRLWGPEVRMTKHRTFIGFAAVALLAVAATAATVRSHPPRTDGIVVSAGTTSLKGREQASDCGF